MPLEEAILQRGADSSATENDASADVKIGIVSDIHGDFDSLDRAIGWFRWMEIERILCPGDLLDIEPFGEEVVQRIKAENAICIRGNHERWALERRRRKPDLRKSGMQACELSDLAGGDTELSHEALQWLAAGPKAVDRSHSRYHEAGAPRREPRRRGGQAYLRGSARDRQRSFQDHLTRGALPGEVRSIDWPLIRSGDPTAMLNASTIVACTRRGRPITAAVLALVWFPTSALAADARPDFAGKLPSHIAAWSSPATWSVSKPIAGHIEPARDLRRLGSVSPGHRDRVLVTIVHLLELERGQIAEGLKDAATRGFITRHDIRQCGLAR